MFVYTEVHLHLYCNDLSTFFPYFPSICQYLAHLVFTEILFHLQDPKESELIVSTVPYEDIQNHSRGVSAQRPSCQQLHNNFFKLLHEGVVSTPAYKSLAVELFKLVVLNTTTAPAEQNLVAEIRRRYSKCDLYAALNYLRDNKILVNLSFC